jgi:UDP-glucose 4-epimerase
MVDLLIKKNFNVTVVDNLVGGRESNISHHSEIELITKDIRDITPKDSFLRNIDYVFHFAGIGDIVPSIESPIEYMSVNNFGTINLLESIRGKKIKKFVYAASSSCYGLAETPTNESNQINLNHPYALSKYQGELSAFHWYDVYKIPVNSIRIFNAYGTRSRTSGAYGAVMGVFLKQKIENKPFTVVGDGSQTRDFLYVTDVVEAFL